MIFVVMYFLVGIQFAIYAKMCADQNRHNLPIIAFVFTALVWPYTAYLVMRK